jgi:uncharacterized membrane protein YdjX (TVP38/TMEM64 family)
VGGIYLLFYRTGLWHFFADKEQLLLFIDSLGVWDEIGFVLLQAVQVVIPLIPGAVLNVLGGYLYGTVSGVIYSSIGTSIGASIAFGLSRKYGKPLINIFVTDYIRRRLGYVLHEEGTSTIFLLFLIPGFPKDYLCYILGLSRYSFMQFFVIENTGRLLGIVLETLGGNYMRHAQYEKIFILVGVVFFIILNAVVFRNKLGKILDIMDFVEFEKEE